MALLACSACGFTPVYQSDQAQGASDITVPVIEGRSGHALRKELLLQVSGGLPGVETGTLRVDYKERIRRFAFKPEGVAGRSNVESIANYTLITPLGAVVGQIEGGTAYNVPDDPYGDIAAQTDAQERAAKLIADRIVQDIRLRLSEPDVFGGRTITPAETERFEDFEDE